MNGPKIAVSLSALALAAVAGYVWWFEYFPPVNFQEVASEKAPLIEDVESYLRVEAFLAQLKARSLSFTIESPPSPSAKTNRPPFNVTTVKVGQFSHLGHPGELIVDFFNDRLVGVRFFPMDVAGYQQALAKTGIDLSTDGHTFGNTRVWSAVDQTGRTYVGWEDVRLAREMEVWIKRYS